MDQSTVEVIDRQESAVMEDKQDEDHGEHTSPSECISNATLASWTAINPEERSRATRMIAFCGVCKSRWREYW